jgi:Type II secretion system (T2SS), protein M subtype b
MIEDMSPLAQRILAVGILVLALLLGFQLVASPLIERMQLSREALADSRYRLHKLESLASQPEAMAGQPVEPGLLIAAPNVKIAQAQLLGQISRIASSTGASVQKVEVLEKQALPSLVATKIELSGNEVSIISFVGQLEGARPMMRLRDWRLQADDDNSGQLKLSAKVFASWDQRR